MRKFSVLVVLALILTAVPLSSEAQSGAISPLDITGSINLIVSPETPRPNETVSIRIEASGINLDGSFITWSMGGKEVQSGRGVKTYSLLAGPLGTQTTLTVSIDTGPETFTRSVAIIPSEIDLLWQGDTYTPPFYKGLPLWSNQSRLVLLAMPHIPAAGGGERNPSTLVYKWSKNGTVLGGVSGVDKSSLVFTDSILSQTQTIKIDILDSENNLLSSATIALTPVRPSILVYENNPLYGFLFHQEVGESYGLKEKEITFASFPLFFSASSLGEEKLRYEWRTNTGEVETRSQVTYRTPENAQGSSRVTARTSNTEKLLQDVSRSFLVQFGQ